MFDGGLLHTVLPSYTAKERNQPRLTLMVGWWDTDVTVRPLTMTIAQCAKRLSRLPDHECACHHFGCM
jgi:hypothetical protein